MSVSERQLKHNLDHAIYYYKNRNTDYTFKDKAIDIIKKTYEPFITNLTQTLQESSTESIVLLAEAAYLANQIPIADHLIKIFFELDNSTILNKNSFYIRALLVKAQVDSQVVNDKNLRAEDAIIILKSSIASIQKSLDIIAKPENKAKYATLLYNSSVITFNMLKKYLKINWSKNFWEILEKLSAMLEESDDVDFNWRILILIKLAQAYIDADKKPEGGKALDKITDILKKKGDCEFQEELYRIRIHLSRDNNGALGNLKKEGEMSATNYPQFKYLYTVQCIKSGVIQEKDIEKEVNGLITAICPDFFKNLTNKAQGGNQSDINVKLEPWKADTLAELGYEILRFKSMIAMSINLFNFLFQSGSNALKGKIFLENIRSQKVLIDLESNLKENVQPVGIIRQKRIDALCESLLILERNMAGCARIQDLDLINETSMLIFNTAMPFFKAGFRKHFAKVFYTSCDLLEQIESNENYLRACMHYELSKHYMEEDLLQEANTNVIKALNNDYSIPLNKVTAALNAQQASLPLSQGQQMQKDQKKQPPAQQSKGAIDDPNLINSITNNVSYLQRNLDQYLIYLKRYIGIKINIYDDPKTIIDKLIFECDNIKNAKIESIQIETINKCLELIKGFSLPEFVLPKSDRDYVAEEEVQMKTIHDLSLYDDKKHFVLICTEIIKYCYEYNQYEAVISIMKDITKYLNDFHSIKDVDQLIALSESALYTGKCYQEYLLEEGIELCSNDYANFETPTKVYTETEKDKFNEWRQGLFDNLQEAIRIGVLINQPWLIFNISIELWNFLLPIARAPTFLSLCNEKLFPVFADAFESLNSSMIYYESINSEINDTDHNKKIDVFVNLTSAYAKFLDFKGKQDECIRICDVMLSRKISSNLRKIFDTIKARALKAPVDPTKKGGAKAQPKQAPGKKEGGAFIPSQDQTLISDCFQTLETAIITTDEKVKVDLLKKGIDQLKTYKINFNDENTIELNSELWYKYGVQFFALGSNSNNNTNFKLSLLCAENSVKTYDNIDIAKNRPEISLTLQKWYCLGFLLYGDSLMKLVDDEKQERVSQITLYFTAIEKILISTKIAEKAKQYYVILQAIKAFYSIVINVIDQPQSREKLCPKFLELHNVLINNRLGGQMLYSDPEFLLLFFSLFCLCINETKNWELGEKVISEGIRIIPNHFHHILLENKLFYYSKQGKSFLQNLQPGEGGSSGGPGGDKDILTKAKLFTKLARSSKNKSDQFNAYNRSIELLKTDQNIYVCDVIFELSTWLYKNNYPFNDVEENLGQAADILLEIEPIFDDEEDLEDEGQTLHSKRSTSSRKSRLSKRSKSRKSGKTGSKRRGSITGVSKSKASERSKSRNYSNLNSRTKTVFAKMLDYDPYPLFLNIQHLQHLFKIHVFLSMVSNDYFKKQEYLLDAFFVLKKILEMSLKTMNCIEFYEKNKDDITNIINNEVNPLSSLINNFYIAKDINIPQVHTMPETLDAWLTYSFPENFINRIIIENANNQTASTTIATQNISLPNYTFFCHKSFEAPYQFYYYFNYMLDKFLNEYFYHSESILMLKFALIYSKHIIGSNELEYSYMLKYQRLVYNIVIQNEGNQLSKEIFNSLKTLEQPKFTPEIKSKQRDELRKYNINLNANNEDAFMALPIEEIDSIIVFADDLRPHIIWIELANEYYNAGYFNYAKDYTEEVLFHTLVLKDKTNYMKANFLLARINFLEANFEQSTSIFNKLQTINQTPDMMYNIITTMTNIFDYMNKYEEMNCYLNGVIDYLQASFETTSSFNTSAKGVKNKTKGDINKKSTVMAYNSSLSIYYQMYSFALICKIRCIIKKYTENIRLNEYNIVKEQQSSINVVLDFYKNEIFPLLKRFNDIIRKNSNNVINIMHQFDFIDITLDCLIKNNLFVYVNKDELIIISDILEQCLHILEEITAYLNHLQTYIPMRIDNSIVYLPIHRLMGIAKIKYGIINNLIGELKSRIKRESRLNEKLSLNDEDINTKFADGTKYNQEVIDYLNSLTKEISKMNHLEQRDNIENMNRYEKSISLLVSCESLILPTSAEYIDYFIEKINSFRLQSLHFKELKDIWNKDTYETIQLIQSNIDKQDEEAIEQNKELQKKIQIQKFHQMTINYISTFEKTVLSNSQYKQILFNCSKEMMKYYFNVIETSGYLNIELSYKGLVDYQNNFAKSYYATVIKRYSNPSSRDWSTFCFNSICKSAFSFGSQFDKIYQAVTYPDSILNFNSYINEIPYYKNSIETFYSNWSDAKNILQTNSAYFIFQMNEDKSILYVGLMTIKGNERAVSYFIKRVVLNSNINGIFDEMLLIIKTMKHILIKTVIVTQEELTRLFEEYNEKIAKILYKMENEIEVLKPIIQELNDVINPPSDSIDNDGTNALGVNKKKTEAKAAAPGKKDKNNNLSPDIQLPSSGIESIVFLIDHRFYELPFEQMSIFSKIPFKSNDFSLNTYIMRLKTVNYNPATMSSISLPGNVKYYLDLNQQTKVDIKNSITTRLGQSGKNATVIEGIISSNHKPSIAELQKLYLGSNMFFFTSQTCLLYQFPFDIFDTSRYSKCRVCFLFDRIANIKNYVDQKSLIPKTFSFNYQPLDTIAMMTLSNVVSVMTTKWSVDYDEISELIENVLEECTVKNINLPYAINKYTAPRRVLIKKEGDDTEKEKATAEVVKGKKEVPGKKKEEIIVLDESNSIEIRRLQLFNLAPIVFGLNNIKLV